MSKPPHSPAVEQPWLFAVSEEIRAENGTVRIIRAVDRVPAEKILKSRAQAAATGKASIAAPALLNCEMKATLLIREAAADLRCSKSQVYMLIEQGKLRTYTISALKHVKKFRQRVLSESVAALINKEIQS